jgi:hypothetical protein
VILLICIKLYFLLQVCSIFSKRSAKEKGRKRKRERKRKKEIQLFSLEPIFSEGEKTKLILPFNSFVMTRNGLIFDDQRPLDSHTPIDSIGFMMAERNVFYS